MAKRQQAGAGNDAPKTRPRAGVRKAAAAQTGESAKSPRSSAAGGLGPRQRLRLGKELDELRGQLATVRRQLETASMPADDKHPWLRIGTTLAAMSIIGRLVERFGFGALGRAAVPMLAAEVDRRMWSGDKPR